MSLFTSIFISLSLYSYLSIYISLSIYLYLSIIFSSTYHKPWLKRLGSNHNSHSVRLDFHQSNQGVSIILCRVVIQNNRLLLYIGRYIVVQIDRYFDIYIDIRTYRQLGILIYTQIVRLLNFRQIKRDFIDVSLFRAVWKINLMSHFLFFSKTTFLKYKFRFQS